MNGSVNPFPSLILNDSKFNPLIYISLNITVLAKSLDTALQ